MLRGDIHKMWQNIPFFSASQNLYAQLSSPLYLCCQLSLWMWETTLHCLEFPIFNAKQRNLVIITMNATCPQRLEGAWWLPPDGGSCVGSGGVTAESSCRQLRLCQRRGQAEQGTPTDGCGGVSGREGRAGERQPAVGSHPQMMPAASIWDHLQMPPVVSVVRGRGWWVETTHRHCQQHFFQGVHHQALEVHVHPLRVANDYNNIRETFKKWRRTFYGTFVKSIEVVFQITLKRSALKSPAGHFGEHWFHKHRYLLNLS